MIFDEIRNQIDNETFYHIPEGNSKNLIAKGIILKIP